MNSRSDIQGVLAEQRRRKDWPTERYLITHFAIQVATQLEQIREKEGLSYQDLADLAGTSKAHVVRLLSGTYAGISNRSLAKLCKALGCEFDIDIRQVRLVSRPARRAPSATQPRPSRS